jgi:GT2 family glycosyltransferase
VTVLSNPSRFTYEIIVADDCSTDGTPRAIKEIGGVVHHIRSQTNLKFLDNCNYAAAQARGRFIVLLNNDTLTLPGWLDHLIEPMSASDGIGLVGSKLLSSDGALQEAGGILWNDGSAWNYGRGQDPRLPEFSYLKDTDYVSGASIALPVAVWRKLGGFDRFFAPAYCEDSDLAFRARRLGLRSIMNPRSELIHHEGVSHGRHLSSGIKSFQVVNAKKFFDRWRSLLLKDHLPNGHHVFLARDRSWTKPHILVVDHYVPQWDKDAGSRSMFDAIRAFLGSGFHVSFWSDNLARNEPYTSALQEMGVEVIYGNTYVGRFEHWWRENAECFQYCFLSRSHIAVKYIDVIRSVSPACTILYYGHDLPWKRLEKEYEVTGRHEMIQEAQQAKDLEDRVCALADYIIYPAEEECAYARNAFPDARGVIQMPLYVYDDSKIVRGEESLTAVSRDRRKIVFVGGFAHRPNGDGIRWFLDEVFPRIREQEPLSEIHIFGSHMPEDIRNASAPGVFPHGWASDEELERVVHTASCTIAPLRFGAGVKGKVISAFVAGCPVVSTSVGMQGIDNPDDIAFVGDSAEEFAEAVVACMREPALAQTKARSALMHIRRRYSRSAFIEAFQGAIPELSL